MLLSVEESVRTRYRSGVTASAEVRLQREMTHDADTFEPSADELIAHNRDFADTFADHDLQVSPTRNLAVVACMDSRMDIFKLLGLGNGEAHIIRNAGGVITDDVIRSLCLSQRRLGTREIVLVHHTDCGLENLREDEFRDEVFEELGVKPRWLIEAFSDPYVDVQQSIQRLEITPFISYKELIRGFVYDVTTGRLQEVERSTTDGKGRVTPL